MTDTPPTPHLIRDLWTCGQDRTLAEAVWNRLQDSLELENDEVGASFAQMREREGVLLADGTGGGAVSAARLRSG